MTTQTKTAENGVNVAALLTVHYSIGLARNIAQAD